MSDETTGGEVISQFETSGVNLAVSNTNAKVDSIHFGLDLEFDHESKSKGAQSVQSPVAAPLDTDSSMLAAMSISRSIRDLLGSAFVATESAEASNQFFTACDKIRELWKHVSTRNQSFRDLLALIEVAIVGKDLEDLTLEQRSAVRNAATELPRSFISADSVSKHRKSFLKCGIDILRPFIDPVAGRRFKISVEEIVD
jgi:hypothetical protein